MIKRHGSQVANKVKMHRARLSETYRQNKHNVKRAKIIAHGMLVTIALIIVWLAFRRVISDELFGRVEVCTFACTQTVEHFLEPLLGWMLGIE